MFIGTFLAFSQYCLCHSHYSKLLEFLSFLINLFIYFWLLWVFVAVRGLSLGVASGDYSFIVVRRLLIAVASLVAEHGL